MHAGLWFALLSGVAVAASCGLRAFLPLLVLGLAARAGVIELRGGSEWLAGDLALVAFGIATVLEIVGDKIPVVDHALDAVASVLRPAAAWLATFALLSGWPTPWAQIAALVFGTLAFTLHGLKAGVRLGSTVTTLGVGNIVLSLLEDVVALLLLAGVVFGSLVLLAVVPLFLWLLSRRRPATLTSTPGPRRATPYSPAS
jgi:hypothetical protein